HFQEFDSYPRLAAEDGLAINERRGKLIIEIRAKCFNASFAAQKYTKHCPWCSAQDEMTLIESAPEYESVEDARAKMGSLEKFLQIFIGEQALLIFLLSLSLISLLGLICLLLIISKQRHCISVLKKRSQLLQPITHPNSYLYSEQLAKPAKNPNDRYDVPWDQKCVLQRFWINENANVDNGNTLKGPRILNRTSTPSLTPIAYIPRKTTITGTISTMSRRLSPNSSLFEHHEDSGLESV
ncbi:unnamed protein product, partial [Onchocerca flexuosa]|uniref:Uncharacterized protein n=1 Tax=Onchocerca flexuosa TaxID=387005 RepID=A0A183HPQ9_9BILA